MTQPRTWPIRVRPGSSADRVGGAYGTGDAARLVVRVCAPAVDGRANAAVEQVLADALGVRRRQVTVVSGFRGRDKAVTVDEPPADLRARWSLLLRDGEPPAGHSA